MIPFGVSVNVCLDWQSARMPGERRILFRRSLDFQMQTRLEGKKGQKTFHVHCRLVVFFKRTKNHMRLSSISKQVLKKLSKTAIFPPGCGS